MADEATHYLIQYISKEQEDREILSILMGELGLTIRKIRSVKWDSQGILLDGKRAGVRERVKEGQELKVLLNDTEHKSKYLQPFTMSLDILYEDEDLLILNKPSGLVCHPSKGHYNDSLANGVQAYFDEKEERSLIHLIGRLDKDTSGIVLVAKNSVVAERMTVGRAQELFTKEYQAIVKGIPDSMEGVITIPMEEYRDEAQNGKLIMRKGFTLNAKEAVTHYRVEKKMQGASLCRLVLDTGRTHQIRFHMSSIGCPLFGDSLYGNGPESGFDRAALHAHILRFTHPLTGKPMVIEAPLPEDMKRFLNSHTQ